MNPTDRELPDRDYNLEQIIRLIRDKAMLTANGEGRAADRLRSEAAELSYQFMCQHGETVRAALHQGREDGRAVVVTDAMVERAAMQIFLVDDCKSFDPLNTWLALPDYGKDRYRDKARAALFAALGVE